MLIASTLAFVIIAPVVVLYAMGYRSPFWEPTQQVVGVLQVEAIPQDVMISIEGEKQGTAPRFISNLQPGSLPVLLTKDGYRPWSKNLLVEPGKAIELRGIRLFPDTPLLRTFARDIQTMSLSPNRLLVAAVSTGNVLQVISQETEETVHTIQLQNTPTSLLWSSDSAYILVGYTDGRYDLVDIAQKAPLVRLPDLTGATQPTWDSRVSGRLLVVRPNHDLVAVSITNGSERVLVSDVQSFAVSSRQLYVVTTTNEIHMHRLQGGFVSNLVSGTPENIQRLYVTPSDDIAILFEDTSVALMSEEDELEEIFPSSVSLAWSPDGSMLLVQPTHNELYVYNVDNERLYHIPRGQQHLVVRLSRSITHPQWYAGGQHIIYQVEDEIIITEIDTRDRPVSYTVDTTNRGDAQVAVGEDGNILYYLKQTQDHIELVAASMLTEADRE